MRKRNLRMMIAGVFTCMAAIMVNAATEDGNAKTPLLNLNTPAGWQEEKNLTAKSDGAIEIKGVKWIFSKEAIKIEPDKTFKLSGSFKKTGNAPTGEVFYLGFCPLDKNKQVIQAYSVNVIPDTDTELTTAIAKGDKVLKVKNAENWKTESYIFPAFKTEPSYSDLPNSNVALVSLTKIEKKTDCYEVTLSSPYNGDEYPAGTKVRQHAAGGYMYVIVERGMDDWVSVDGQVKGRAKSGAPADKWWPGCEYVRIIAGANNHDMKDVKLTSE